MSRKGAADSCAVIGPSMPTPQEWRRAYEQLPENIKEAIWMQCPSACPDCGVNAVPIAWAVVAIQVATGMKLL